RQPACVCARPAIRRGHRLVRPQPGAVGAAGAARPQPVRGARAGGDARADAVPADRLAAGPCDARAARFLLVQAGYRVSTMLHLDESALVEHVRGQRWFGAKSRELVGANVLDTVTLRELDPALYLVLAELRYPEGTHDLY